MSEFRAKSLDLVWIMVKDFDEAVKFYKDVLGLVQKDFAPEYNWIEFEGVNGGARLGICAMCEDAPIQPGSNAVVSLTVDDLDQAIDFLKTKGAALVGETQEVPHHVKMQLIQDPSGNFIHICQLLN